MTKATLNKNCIATKAGDVSVYNYDGETREYLSTSVEYLALGVGIPANSCTDAPIVEKAGFAICRTADGAGWEYVADHRGETVYSTETGAKVIISAPGVYPADTTPLAPATPYDRWNGAEWVTDTAAQQAAAVASAEAQKQALLQQAQSTISIWQTELQMDIISDEDKTRLLAWLKYIKALQAADVSTAPDIVWPEKPE
ncbi:tail fiber assembly protein [Cronobacter sakazakii]|nr:tail fiber assembly protein [Cronobacter sakazakii]EGT4327017.1 tail fiber assembly protein [Cronobacter sakazakii]EGT4364595.1 tail fiber assembly protein [Cronobacter sakazakii]